MSKGKKKEKNLLDVVHRPVEVHRLERALAHLLDMVEERVLVLV